jgi:LacI family transcriptional regulator, galactose operon repressor
MAGMTPGRRRTAHPARRIGVQDIADALGISCGTVDRALHDRPGVNQATKRSVLNAARRLGYRPNLAARYLSSRKHLTIGVSLPLEVAYFFDAVREGVVEAASSYEPLGVKILYRPYKRFGQHEVEALRDILEEDISGLVVAPAYHERLRADMERAIRRGIPTVCVVSDAPGTDRLTCISVDPFTNGALAGELMAHLLAGEGSVIVFIGMHAAVDHEQKVRGFESSLKAHGSRARVAAVVEAHDEEEEAYQKCRRVLAQHPSARGIYIATANSIPVIRALDEMGLAGKIKVIGTDLFPAMVPIIESGKIAATIHQRPRDQGLTAIRTLVRFLTEGLRPPAQIQLDPAIVMRSNLSLFFPRQPVPVDHQPR